MSATLDELIYQLHYRDFGIYIELEPDDEDKAKLEAKYSNSFTEHSGIDLEDAIDIRR